jgi:hypothetical protein
MQWTRRATAGFVAIALFAGGLVVGAIVYARAARARVRRGA